MKVCQLLGRVDLVLYPDEPFFDFVWHFRWFAGTGKDKDVKCYFKSKYGSKCCADFASTIDNATTKSMMTFSLVKY
jgi:hypothetical protein